MHCLSCKAILGVLCRHPVGRRGAGLKSVFLRRMGGSRACNSTTIRSHCRALLALLPALRKRKLAIDKAVDRGARATEEARLKREYALRLAAIIQEAKLPVCKVLAGVSDAEEAWPRLFGTRRSKTLRNRLRSWSKFREWLIFSRGRPYPEGVADVLDFAAERFREGCGKTVLDSFQASMSVLESVGRVQPSCQISQDPTWQAQLKSYTADLVSEAPPEQPASMLTTAILVSLEIFICTQGLPAYLRALGFVCLLMVWGSLRADDVQGLLPQTMTLDERGLSIELRQVKDYRPRQEDTYGQGLRGKAHIAHRA